MRVPGRPDRSWVWWLAVGYMGGMRRSIPAFLLLCTLSGCSFLADLLSSDSIIDASCAGTDTVVVDGRDLCEEFEKFGKIDCDVGYRIYLDGQKVCPSAQ